MSTEILMPALSPTMTEGNLSKWLIKKGDSEINSYGPNPLRKNNSQIVMNNIPEVTNVSTQQTKDYIDEKIAEKFSERNISEKRGFFLSIFKFLSEALWYVILRILLLVSIVALIVWIMYNYFPNTLNVFL